MSKTTIPPKTILRLWLHAGGRCEFEGCNDVLWRDDLTMEQLNVAYVAHIVSDSPDGPRGDRVRSPSLAKEFSNLMLLCDKHHRLVDNMSKVVEFPESRLVAMKRIHEDRIERLTSIAPSKKSEVLLYGANIGNHSSPVSYGKAVLAMIPERYPLTPTGISLGLKNSSMVDHDELFWRVESAHLRQIFAHRVESQLKSAGGLEHLSIFAVAPQPLLMLLGFLLSDIPSAEVYQLHREPADWRWQEHPKDFSFIVERPKRTDAAPALIFALSAHINSERITRALGKDASEWRVTINVPNNDFLKSRLQLQQFRETIRPLLDVLTPTRRDASTSTAVALQEHSALPAIHRQPPQWPMDESYHVQIRARAARDGFRTIEYRPGQPPLRKGFGLDFDARTNVPRPFAVFWQVVNTGAEATQADDLRGGFNNGRHGLTWHETTKYSGIHSMQCFIVKDGTCVARSPEFLVRVA